GGSLQQCAQAICDTIRCAFLQQAGIVVQCTFQQVIGSTFFKLTLTLPNLPIDWGNFNICVSLPPVPAPVITSVTPAGGGPGTIVTVRGTNFPTDPNDICMVIMDGGLSIPIEV